MKKKNVVLTLKDLRPAQVHFDSLHMKTTGLRTVVERTVNFNGMIKGLILAGAHGLGKSFLTWEVLDEYKKTSPDTFSVFEVKGHITPMSLYFNLNQAKEPGSVALFDDADEAFTDQTAMNILKAAADKTSNYRVYWESTKDNGMPKTFNFSGGKIIIITNTLMHKSEHYKALTDRYFYFNYSLSPDEIKAGAHEQAIAMITEKGYNETLTVSAYKWFVSQTEKLTFRRFGQAVDLAHTFGAGWEPMAQMMLL